MRRLTRLLTVTFLESFATICVERGIYFFTEHELAFSDAANLWLALLFGLFYIAGALTSHRLAHRTSEKHVLAFTLVGQAVVVAALAAWPVPVMVYVSGALLGWLNGTKWPVVESYVSAGLTPRRTASVIGRFNVCWAVAVPSSLVVAGPMIAWIGGRFFLLPAVVSVVSLLLARSLEQRPVHLPDDHPERPDAAGLGRLQRLLGAGRWLMVASYSSMWILAALLPGVFARLGFTVGAATGLSSVLDAGRVTAFVTLQVWPGWHGRALPLFVAAAGLASGFFMTLFGPHIAVVLAGEALFGLSIGTIYYAALYYAMVVKNASVDAGGGHESLIGSGFAIGPTAGLLALWLAPRLGGPLPGNLATVGLLFLLCTAGAIRSVLRRTKPPRCA
jgi:hypothetical protein